MNNMSEKTRVGAVETKNFLLVQIKLDRPVRATAAQCNVQRMFLEGGRSRETANGDCSARMGRTTKCTELDC